jgi:rubrerythrin
MGGRSRVAAQMLSGKGFNRVINLAGGIKAWNGERAFFSEEKGLDLFTGEESPDQALITAYGLEMGLEHFYISMAEEAKDEDVKEMFQKLSLIEVKHRKRIFEEYIRIFSKTISEEEFTSELVIPASEGGMSTEEYIQFFKPDLESSEAVIELAMSIEAQALDLYFRASERADHDESRKFLIQMADEERSHLVQLGRLMESVIEKGVNNG